MDPKSTNVVSLKRSKGGAKEENEKTRTLPYSKWQLLPVPDHRDDYQGHKDATRLNSLGSLFFFAQNTVGYSRLSELHKQLCTTLEKEYLFSVLEVPMSHFKTRCGIALSIWWSLPFNDYDEEKMRNLGYGDSWIKYMRAIHSQNHRTLITHEIAGQAANIGRDVDACYHHNDKFSLCFPEILPDRSCVWNNSEKYQKRLPGADSSTATFVYRGVGQALQGIHVNSIIQDDNVGREAQQSVLRGDGRVMEDVIRWHKQVGTRFDPVVKGARRQLVIGNRWTHHDLNGWIRKNQPEFKFETHSAEGGCCIKHKEGRPILPTEWSMELLEREKQRLGKHDYCFPYDAPVLMANWKEKPIYKIEPGEIVVGFKPGTGEERKQFWHITPSKVIATGTRVAWVVKATLESGRTVMCTSDHRWFVCNSRRAVQPYLPLSIGRPLISVYTPMPIKSLEEQRDLDWLGGILDGEGTCNPSSLNIGQSESKNPEVCRAIEETCARLGISTHRNNAFISAAGKEGYSWNLHGGRSLLVRMVQNARMAKQERFVAKLWARPKLADKNGFIVPIDKVVSIEPISEQKVFNITTETGNFVAYGYATKNSHFYLNIGTLPGEQIFDTEELNFFRFKQSRPDLALEDLRNILLLEHEVKDGKVIEDFQPGGLALVMVVGPNDAKKVQRTEHVIWVVGYDTETMRIYLMSLWAEDSKYSDLVEEIYRTARRWQLSDFWMSEHAKDLLDFYMRQRDRLEPEKSRLSINTFPDDDQLDGMKNRIEALEPLMKQMWAHRGSQKKFLTELQNYPTGKLDTLDVLGYFPQTMDIAPPMSEWMRRQQERFANRGSGAGGY